MAAKKKSKTKKKLGSQCKCIDEVNKELEKIHPNLMLNVAISITYGAICVIPVAKRESFIRTPSGQNIKHVQARYCPFCGKKYVTE